MFDVIGDIHGYADELEGLLIKLGYELHAGVYRHPERRTVFVGDFIDRGPKVRETLQIVRAMVDSGSGLAVIGNHEYNAVCYSTKNEGGDWLRPHLPEKAKQIQTTLAQFAEYGAEWEDYLKWFKTLPLSLELEGLRVVHAAWHAPSLELIDGRTLADDEFLQRSAVNSSSESDAVEMVLKGPEIPLPRDNSYEDSEGTRRTRIRVKWWENPRGKSYRDLVFPESNFPPDDEQPSPEHYANITSYPESAPPVFIGHYWHPPETPRVFGNGKIACLDYGVAKDGFLVAYRWDGEQVLDQAKFITAR